MCTKVNTVGTVLGQVKLFILLRIGHNLHKNLNIYK